MTKIERITIGSIDNLTDGKVPEEIGHSTIEESVGFGTIKIKTPYETRRIKATNFPEHRATSRKEFLEFVEETLKTNGWYLAEAEYTPYRCGFFSDKPHRLSGRLYVEKKS
jgi:hypothetical protein